jgi:general secretion pathway protein C
MRADGTTLADYEMIVQRNLFDSKHTGILSLATNAGTGAPSAAPASFTLLGTVTAGTASLALIDSAGKTLLLHLGDTAPGGGRVVAIERSTLRLRHDNGSEESIPLRDAPLLGDASVPASGGARPSAIRATGNNRYSIPRQEVEKARANIGELLKQARLEPNIVGGQTHGFVVRMIRPESILASLGLKLGDVVMQVNSVPLDTPEKALQIFQQLREARHIALNLERNGTPISFEYDLD